MIEELIYFPKVYKEIIEIFAARLKMKHLLKGASHRQMDFSQLDIVVAEEMEELDIAIGVGKETRIIEEACDVMIAALLIGDKVIHGDKE